MTDSLREPIEGQSNVMVDADTRVSSVSNDPAEVKRDLDQIIALVGHIARNLVDNPDAVKITSSIAERTTIIELTVAQEDTGQVIGKQGRIAKAVRAIVKAAAVKQGRHYVLNIM